MRRELTRESMRELMRELARTAPSGERAYARYPNLSRNAVLEAVDGFLSETT